MCNPAAAAQIGLAFFGTVMQQRARASAQDQAFAAQSREIDRQTEALRRRVAAQRDQQAIQLQANQAQRDAAARRAEIANEQKDELRRRVTKDLGDQGRQTQQIEERRGKKLGNVVTGANAAEQAGQARQVGSNVQGRVSEDFTARGESAASENEARAKRLAGQLATIGAFKVHPLERADRIAQIGLALAPFARRQQHHDLQSRLRAAEDRVRVRGAGIVDPVPREGLTVIDPNSRLGDALVGAGGAAPFINFGGGGPTTSSGGGGGPGTWIGPVYTQTRGS